MDLVSVFISQAERNHPLVQSAVLGFFDAVISIPVVLVFLVVKHSVVCAEVCEIYQTYDVPLMILPFPSIVCRLMFSLNVSGTAGMCRMLVK